MLNRKPSPTRRLFRPDCQKTFSFSTQSCIKVYIFQFENRKTAIRKKIYLVDGPPMMANRSKAVWLGSLDSLRVLVSNAQRGTDQTMLRIFARQGTGVGTGVAKVRND